MKNTIVIRGEFDLAKETEMARREQFKPFLALKSALITDVSRVSWKRALANVGGL